MSSGFFQLAKTGLLRTLLAELRIAVRLMREPAVPAMVKAVPAFAALYLISPLDLIPDLLPLIGQLDDIGVILAAVQGFIHLCPDTATAFHRAAVAAGRRFSPMPRERDGFIDTDFRAGPS
jgi:uncharacterized membrane protein YkvA (DUF1232 family)